MSPEDIAEAKTCVQFQWAGEKDKGCDSEKKEN